MRRGGWETLVQEPAAERHLVQVYRDPAFLVAVVARWLAPPLERGGAVLILATRRHAEAVLRRLAEERFDTEALVRSGRLAVIDAERVAEALMEDGAPRRDVFMSTVGEVLQSLRQACVQAPAELRGWGELVNVLRERGEAAAAQRVEAYWNEVMDQQEVRLLCSYRIDNLDPASYRGPLREVCSGHSQLIPEADYARFDAAVNDAIADVYGEQEAGFVRATHARRRVLPISMPAAQAILVSLQDADPSRAERVLQAVRRHLVRAGAPR